MDEITTRIGAIVAAIVAVVLAVACSVLFFELHAARGTIEQKQEQERADSQSLGTLRGQLATSQSDLQQAANAARVCTASVEAAASEAKAVQVAAAAASAAAAARGVTYQNQIDALTRRLQDPTNEKETCDAALDRLRSSL